MALHKHALIQFLKEFNIPKPTTFEDRIIIQKIVYFAKYLGIEFDYNFNIYFRGPYSSELAKDYYDIDNDWTSVKEPLSISSEQIKKINFIRYKSIAWLEIASTLLAVKSANPNFTENELINHVYSIKRDIIDTQCKSNKKSPKEFLSGIYYELKTEFL